LTSQVSTFKTHASKMLHTYVWKTQHYQIDIFLSGYGAGQYKRYFYFYLMIFCCILSLETVYEWFESWNLKATVTNQSETLKIATIFVCFNNTVVIEVLETSIPQSSVPTWTFKCEIIFLHLYTGILRMELPSTDSIWTSTRLKYFIYIWK